MFLRASIRFILFFILSNVLEESFSEVYDHPNGGSVEDICRMCEKRRSSFNISKKCGLLNHVNGRCCQDHKNSTIGLDLGNCSVSSMISLQLVRDIQWLNLDCNPNLTCNGTQFKEKFKGITKLQNVSLPESCQECPGGNDIWQSHWKSESSLQCQHQLSSCKVLNVTCPDNSECQNNGPGFTQCLCKGDWIGYKCLRKDGIPLLIILCSIAGGTLVVTLGLWCLLRKQRKRYSQGYTWVQ